MNWYNYIASFFAGIFLANAVPHFVHGISGDRFPSGRLLVFRPGDEIVVSSDGGAHFMLFGGASLGSQRYIWWNFVSSSEDRIEQAKEDWRSGRFAPVPDEAEFIPLPNSGPVVRYS